MSRNHIISVFPNADLRCSHLGLTIEARKKGKDPRTLDHGDFLLFINRRQSAMKLFGSNNTIIHHRAARGRIELRTIQYIPQCFHAGKFDYDKALGIVLEKKLKFPDGNPVVKPKIVGISRASKPILSMRRN